MSYLKRQKVPKNWPIHRKGTAYVVRPNANLTGGLPVLIVLRDMLGIAQNRKEVKKSIHSKLILLNSKPVKDEKNSICLFDVLTIVPSGKNYRLELSERGKFGLEEIKENEAGKKIAKIINRKILRGGKTQLNLSDGNNFLSNVKCKVNDSVLIDLKNKKIEKCLPLEEGKNVLVFAGKHAGVRGKVNKLKLERKMAKLKVEGKEINVLIKQLIAVE